jgi:hypothetical protein
MPSRAELRLRLEQALRATVLVALALMLWRSLRASTDSSGSDLEASGIRRGALASWSALSKAPERIHVALDSVPTPLERAWLSALAGAGSAVTWSGDLPSLMLDAQPIAAPTGGTRVLIAAPKGSSVELRDEIGVIDTVRAGNAGAAVSLASDVGDVSVRVKGASAFAGQGDSLQVRRVLVIGSAGWESKFVAAALEEEGWRVDAIVRVAPGVEVKQGKVTVIDTLRYSAVIALDSAAAPYANRIVEFVATGGGVIILPAAATIDGLASLRSGSVGRANAPSTARPTDRALTLATLPLAPVASLRSDAVAIERRGEAVAVAARRIAAGRAIQLGYEDTWRWRMEGGDDAVRDHRSWWTSLVSKVAYAPRTKNIFADSTSDAAPMAALVASLGPSTRAATSNLSLSGSEWMAWLFAILTLALLLEIGSRRLRGVA